MRFTLFLTLAYLLPSLTLGACLTKTEYKNLLSRWVSIFNHLDIAVARKTTDPNIKVFSDSNDFLFGNPPGSLTGRPFWANRTDLIAGQRYAQGMRNATEKGGFIRVLQSTYGCDTITFHWRADGTVKGEPQMGSTNKKGDPVGIAGIDFLKVDNSVKPKRVRTAWSEYNVGEVLYTSGFRICFQRGNDSACDS